jgi:PRD1 phage membrane DNA delivery
MFEGVGAGLVAVVGGIITLAIIAVVVSRQAQTPQVLQAGGSALAAVIGAAVQPVTGNSQNTFGGIGQNIGGIGGLGGFG